MHDSQRALVSASRALTRHLSRVGRRVLWFKLLRGAAFAVGASCTALLLFALLSGPSLSVFGATLVWAGLLLCTALAGAVGVGSLDDLSGARRAKLIRANHPALAARARSAAELASAPNGSPELIASLTQAVSDELAGMPLSQVVPAPRHFGASFSGASALALGCALLLVGRDDAAVGLYALLHPGAHDEQGSLVGLWVSELRAHVTYPSAFGRDEDNLKDLRSLAVPEGALLELVLIPRFSVERAVLKLGERTLPWTRRDDGSFALSITAEESGRLDLRARVSSAWISDPTARQLDVENDAAPVVDLLTPASDQNAELDQHVPFVYRARDDHGLDGVDLVVQLGPNRERRLRLSSYARQVTRLQADGNTEVVPAGFGARPGQTLAVWIEARDRDSFGGANIGRSPVRTIRVGESNDEKGPELALLIAARDRALDALADRLEAVLGDESDGARTRKLAKSMRELVHALSALADGYDATERSPNESLVRDMNRRITRLLREESAANDASSYAKLDRNVVSELEEDTLWLADLIGRDKLQAAEGALSRLASTRARMRKLLEQLKQSDDPAQRAELLAEIARARAEMSEVAGRLDDAQADVPSDFVNYDALKRETAQDPLEQLEEALAKGDMEAAEKALATLDERMASLENGLQTGGDAFRSERFGKRNAQLDKARGEVRELEQTQAQLAKESDRVAEKARGRGAEEKAFEAESQRLAQQSEALEKRTRELEAGRTQPAVAETQRTAAQRLRDAHDALKQGEANEARSMAERAASDLDELATEMRLDARMFPGRDGSRLTAAKKAEELARDVARFAQEMQGNAPREPDQLSGDERESLKKQAPSQGKLGERAGKLAESSRSDGPSGMPGGLERATQAMRAAENALEHGDLGKARAQQREALERLRDVSQQLEQQAKASQGEPGKDEGSEGSARNSADEKVTIPGGEGDTRRSELRRRVLDARRAPTPDSFERSVERYYQEILR
ncbi:MAG: domain protein putative component of TonB system [Myxococcaceae bacterium]|nr:domain protein putative component of TonB system [Myxococcaceae bacterium]